MTKGKVAQAVTLVLALCAAGIANIGMLQKVVPEGALTVVMFVLTVVASALPSLIPQSAEAVKKIGPGLLLLLVFGCTPQQLSRVQDVKAQAKNLCEARLLERLAPVLLTEQQAEVALEAARYACLAAESECVDEVLKFRKSQLELQAPDAGPPPVPPAPVPEADAAPTPAQP